MTLNAEQTAFNTLVLGGNFSRLLLTGEGGAGKTYALCKTIGDLIRSNQSVVVCAPTHTARENLLAKMDDDIRHLVETKTVASLLKRFGFKTDMGGTGFTAPEAVGAEYSLIVIDEVSMIGKKEYDAIMASSAKVILTGDFAQLPPVLQESPDWDAEVANGNLQLVHFKEQMRALGPIHELAQKCRDEVVFPTENVSDEDSAIIVHASRSELIERMIADICANPAGLVGMADFRYLTHTNAMVTEIGAQVRDAVITHFLGAEAALSAPFTVGEKLMSYQTSAAAYNGDVVTVEGVEKDHLHDRSMYNWDSWMITVSGARGTTTIRTISPREVIVRDNLTEQYRNMLTEAYKRKDATAIEEYLERIEHLTEHWVKFGYVNSLTAHKSQGQSIPHVYLDTLAIDRAGGKKKLLYVGVSRASRELHTIFVPEKVWRAIRGINEEFKAAKERYEEVFGEPHWKFKLRMIAAGAIDGAQTPAQKAALTALYEEAIESRLEELDALLG